MTQDLEPRESGTTAQTKEPENKTGLDRLKDRLYRPGPLVVIFGLVMVVLALVIAFLITSEPPAPRIVQKAENNVLQAAPPSSEPHRVYEETFGHVLEEQVKQADFALLEALRKTGIDMQRLELSDVRIKEDNGRRYHYQELRIPGIRNRDKFLLTLQECLAKRVPGAFLAGDGSKVVNIDIDKVRTHSIYLDRSLPAPVYPAVKGPKLVIVIDDVGENLAVLKGLLKLNLPLVYAVWPMGSHTTESVRLIHKAEHDLIIHYPMEPKAYPKVDPGPGALFTSMKAGKIRKTMEKYMAMVPGAIGANNHMGSRFTESGPGMRVALSTFKKHGLFFLDSMTTPKSVARSVAQKIKIPFYKRDVFLDNVKEVPAIIHQLRKAERIAKRRGRAIAIGHNYAVTLSALRQWADLKDSSVLVLPLSRLQPE